MSEVSVVTQVHERVWTAYGRSSWASNLTLPTPSRALVLGGGGATGIGWLGGLIIGLREQGIDLGTADTVIGTSAGSVVGTLIGAALLGLVPGHVLLPMLAVLLVASAWKIWVFRPVAPSTPMNSCKPITRIFTRQATLPVLSNSPIPLPTRPGMPRSMHCSTPSRNSRPTIQ